MAIEIYKTKSGIRYKATLWHKNELIARESFSRKIDAQEWIRREKTKIQDKKVGRLRGDSTTLREFFKNVYSLHHGVRPSTWPDYKRMYLNHFDEKFGKRNLTDISEEDWATLLKQLKNDGMGNARCNRIHAVASAIYSVAMKWRYVHYNPLTLVDYEKEDLKDFRYWSFDECSTFFYWASENSNHFHLYHLVYELGLRISEALALKWDCIDFNSGTITILRAYSREARGLEETTKSGRKRVLWMSAGLRNSLLELIQKRNSSFVFSGEKGLALRYERVREVFKKEQLSAGLTDPIGIHGLRHTFASHFIMRGGNIYDLKTLMGHSDVATTMRYVHLGEGHLREKSLLVQLKLPVKNNVVNLARP